MATYHRVTVRCGNCGNFSPLTGLGVSGSGEVKLEANCGECKQPTEFETTADELFIGFNESIEQTSPEDIDLRYWVDPRGIAH